MRSRVAPPLPSTSPTMIAIENLGVAIAHTNFWAANAQQLACAS